MLIIPSGVKIHLALGHTDMRNYAPHTNMQSQQRRTRIGSDAAAAFSPHNYWSSEPHSALR